MIKEISTAIQALEILGIPKKIKEIEGKSGIMGPPGPKGAKGDSGTGGGTGLIIEDTSDPVGKPDGYFSVVDDVLWYFTGSHRYKLTATLDDPILTTTPGMPIGLLLTLTYS